MTYEKYAEHIHDLANDNSGNKQQIFLDYSEQFLKRLIIYLKNKYKNELLTENLKEQIKQEFIYNCHLYFNGNIPFDKNSVSIENERGKLWINISQEIGENKNEKFVSNSSI